MAGMTREQSALGADFIKYNCELGAKFVGADGERVPISIGPMSSAAWPLHQPGLPYAEVIFYKPCRVNLQEGTAENGFQASTVIDHSPSEWVWYNVGGPMSGIVVTNSGEAEIMLKNYVQREDLNGKNKWITEIRRNNSEVPSFL